MSGKKGVSEVVSYVLLVVITVGIAVIVYGFVSLYVPKDTPNCDRDVFLTVENIQCSTSDDPQSADPRIKEFTITFYNKGLHTVDAAYVRVGENSRNVPVLLRKEQVSFTALSDGFKPGNKIEEIYSLSPIAAAGIPKSQLSNYYLEVEPSIINDKNQLTLCEQATITQKLDASSCSTLTQKN